MEETIWNMMHLHYLENI